MSSPINNNIRTQDIQSPAVGGGKGVHKSDTQVTTLAEKLSELRESGMNTQQSGFKRPVTQNTAATAAPLTPEQKAAQLKTPQERLDSAAAMCKAIATNPKSSPEARATYGTLATVLTTVQTKIDSDFGGNYTQENIQKALQQAVAKFSDLSRAGGTGTVGMFDKKTDDYNPEKKTWGATTGKASSWGKPQLSIKVCEELNIPQTIPADKSHKANPKTNTTSDDFKTDRQTGGTIFRGDGFSIRCDEGIEPKNYIKQFNRDIESFSGDVHVHKLEPGTVLVRVYGQGQSPLRACWCRLDDSTSSVTKPEDLLTKLAVLPNWNGDGNLAIMVVPESPEVVVAEGVIAKQKGQYSAPSEVNHEFIETGEFVFQGGGTQCNVMTHDLPEGQNGFPPFANDPEGKLNGCMFCCRDTNLACIENV